LNRNPESSKIRPEPHSPQNRGCIELVKKLTYDIGQDTVSMEAEMARVAAGRSGSNGRKRTTGRVWPALAVFAVLASLASTAGPTSAQTQVANASDSLVSSADLNEYDWPILFSSSRPTGLAGDVRYYDEDVVGYDPATGDYHLEIDGSDLGFTTDINGVVLLDDGSYLLTFAQRFQHPDLGLVQDADIIRFIPSSTGGHTEGRVEIFLDGSDLGLTTYKEDIDALAVSPDGDLLISTWGVAGTQQVQAEPHDLLRLLDPAFGSETEGTLESYLDGSQSGLDELSERVRGASSGAPGEDLFLVTLGAFDVPEVTGTDGDVLRCEQQDPGSAETSCAFSLFTDSIEVPLLNALHVGAPSKLGSGPECETEQETLEIDSHTDGDRVDTTEDGSATGSFFLSGRAPRGSDAVVVAVAGEVEPAELDIEPCVVNWMLEVTPLASGPTAFVVESQAPSGLDQLALTLDLVAAGEDDLLLQPRFAETEQFHDRLISFDDESGELVFSGDLTADVEPGDGLGGDVSDRAPEGYLRIVLSVDFDGTNTVVATRQAGLSELMRQVDISYETDPDEIEPMIFETEGAVGDIAADTTDVGRLIRIGEDADFIASVNLDPSFKFDLNIRWDKPCWICPAVIPTLERFWIEGGLDFTAKAEFKYVGATLLERQGNFGPRFDDFRLGGLTIPTPIGVPLIFTFEAESQAFWEVSINAGLKVEYELGFNVTAGYEYDIDGTGRGGYRDASFIGGPPSLDDVTLGILAEVAAGLEIDFEVLLYGKAGIELEAKPKVVLETAGDVISREIRWELKLAIPFEAGFEIEIDLGPFNWEREFGDVQIAELNLVLFEGVIGGAGEPQLELEYTGPPGAFPGQEYEYRVLVKNEGDGLATGVVVTLELPDIGSFVSSSPVGSPTSPPPGSTYTIELADIRPGEFESAIVRWKAPTPGGEDAISSATVRADDVDPVGPEVSTVPVGLVSNCNPCGATASGVGLRNRSEGSISIEGLPEGATVTRAVLIWGILYDGARPRNTITFDGSRVTADVAATVSGNLCWGDTATVGYAADVTDLVDGNGVFTVSDPPRGITRVDDDPVGVLPYTDGASLIVFYVGGGSSSQVLSDFTYNTNTAEPIVRRFDDVRSQGFDSTLILAGPDGQTNAGENITISGSGSISLVDTWDGSDSQSGPSFPIGNLWDTDYYDVSSILPAGQTSLSVNNTQTSDCIGVGATVLIVDQVAE
jgi:hypothetical protein